MVVKKGVEDLAIIVDSCGLDSMSSAEWDSAYIPYPVKNELMVGGAKNGITGSIITDILNALEKERKGCEVTQCEDYMQIRSFVSAGYECAAMDDEGKERGARRWDSIMGMGRRAFADSVSGLIYDLTRKDQPKKSITISCANRTKDNSRFKEDVIDSLKPMVQLGIFKDLGISYKEGEGRDIIIFTNERCPEDGESIKYAFGDMGLFAHRFNEEQKTKDASEKLDRLRSDRKYGDFARSVEQVARLCMYRQDRLIKKDDSDTGRRMEQNADELRKYEPLLAKTIMFEVMMNHYEPGADPDMIVYKAKQVYDQRLAKAGIRLPDEAREAAHRNLEKHAATSLRFRESNKPWNDSRADVDIVAAAYAVPESNVQIKTMDTDVVELLFYAKMNGMPKKNVSISPAGDIRNPILNYMREKESARDTELKQMVA